MSREIRLFWSGGWDSTFRLLQLSQIEQLVIRPIYIRDHARLGMLYELSAMRSILPLVRNMAKADILDVELYDRGSILRVFPDEKISTAYTRLAEEFHLGYQYELFALLCKGLDVRVECAVEKSDRSKARRAIETQCMLVPVEEELLAGKKRFRVVGRDGYCDTEIVFENLVFGMLDVAKTDVREIAEENGWTDIMDKTWFCHSPVNGHPCGRCNPCKDALAEGMSYRLPLASRIRRFT